MKHIAIFGAGGFVGARWIEMAQLNGGQLDGFEIIPIFRQPRSLGRLAKFGLKNHRFANVAKSDTLPKALAGCDVAVNMTVGDNARTVPDLKNLYEACASEGVRLLIHLSSAEIYGRADTPDLNDESPWFRPHWMEYGREKGKAEDWLRTLPEGKGPLVVTLRPGLVWGPGSMWASGAAQSMWNGTAFLVDDGKWACNLCYVDNLIQSMMSVATHAHPKTGFYNVGDDFRPDWKTFYTALAKEMGFEKPPFSNIRESDYKESAFAKLLQIKEHSAFQALKRRFRNQTKSQVKVWLMQMRRRLFSAPAQIKPSPQITKGMWWLQTTRYHLPTAKFKAEFGVLNHVTFEDAMARTGEWLRFSGFTGDWRS